jgi:hypothetical protein
MKNVFRVCVIALLGVASLAPSTFAADSCSGGCPKLPKNARAVSAQGVPLACVWSSTLTATLAKGKKKRILTAEGLLTDAAYMCAPAGCAARFYVFGPLTVNGLPMQPWSYTTQADCSSAPQNCSISGHWWLDMDDPANAALIGVPITVTMNAGDIFCSSSPPLGNFVDQSLRVRLEKK